MPDAEYGDSFFLDKKHNSVCCATPNAKQQLPDRLLTQI